MKKLVTLLLMAIAVMGANAQEFRAPAKQKVEFKDSTTTYTYRTSDDKVYKVYVSKSGAYYIWKTSKKSGKLYKNYLPKDVQKQMGRKYNNE